MKMAIRILVELIIVGIAVALWYVINSTYSSSTIATTVATVLGFALTAVGTIVGLISISNSNKASIRQHEMLKKEYSIKLSNEIYNNLLVPLQHVMNSISILGDALFIKEMRIIDGDGNVFIPEGIAPQLKRSINEFSAKFNMVILYADKGAYIEMFEFAKCLSIKLESINKSIDERKWNEESSKRLIESRNEASNLYENIVNLMHRIKNDA